MTSVSLNLLQHRALTFLRLKIKAHYHPDHVLSAHVARYLGLSNQQATACLERLAKKGLAERVGHSSWALTEGGLAYEL